MWPLLSVMPEAVAGLGLNAFRDDGSASRNDGLQFFFRGLVPDGVAFTRGLRDEDEWAK